MINISKEKLESIIIKTIEELPDNLKEKLENVDIIIEDSSLRTVGNNRTTLGLYQGIPLSERGTWYTDVLPDRITIFKSNIEALCNSEGDVENIVREVVIHEIAHYFGFGEDEIRKAGY